MENHLPRTLAAILYADVAGYSRLTGEDEDATHRALTQYLDLVAASVESHGGRVKHYAGDAVLAQFSAVLDALSSSVAIQKELRIKNEPLPSERMVQFRIGINLGDVIEDRGDIFGDGVNVAARLEALAEPGGICVSDAVRTAIGNKLPLQYAFIGEHSVKNIVEPVRAYRVFEGNSGETTSAGSRSATSGPTAGLPFGKPSLAIKPFQDMGPDAEENRLADAITNGISVALTRLPQLILVSDESPSMIESKRLSVAELGGQFGVRYVLKGTVRKLGERIRVSAELVEVKSGEHLWGDNVDRELHDFGDFFDVQDEIIEEVVTALEVKLLHGEAARLVRRALKDPVALERYYRGEDLMWRSTMKLEFREAQQLFEETIRLEPESPVGYATGALSYWIEAISGLSDAPSDCLQRASELARDAIRLGDVTGYAHLVMAHVYLHRRQYEDALSEATRTVSDRPSCPAAFSIKASVLTYLDRADEAIEYAQYALRLTPVHPPMYPAVLASAFYGCDRFEEAIDAAKDAIRLRGTDISPHLYLVAANAALNRMEDARREASEALSLEPSLSLAHFAESHPYKETTTLQSLMNRLENAGLT